MTVAIRPPGYFPPLHDTAFLAHVDHFVLADTFRFRRQSFHNRSKLRNAQGGHWITVPVFGQPEGAPLHTVTIETKGRWQEKHWRSFLYDYRSTMYFDHYQQPLRSFYEQTWTSLADCSCRSVALQVDLFGFRTTLTRASELPGAPSTVEDIVAAVDADTLLVAEDEQVPEQAVPTVRRLAFEHPTYHQNFEGFVSGTSAMDLVLNYGPEARRIVGEAATQLQEESP